MATLSCRRRTMPVCCSPSRKVTSWILTRSGKCSCWRTSGAQFHGLVNHWSVFHGWLILAPSVHSSAMMRNAAKGYYTVGGKFDTRTRGILRTPPGLPGHRSAKRTAQARGPRVDPRRNQLVIQSAALLRKPSHPRRRCTGAEFLRRSRRSAPQCPLPVQPAAPGRHPHRRS